MLLPDLLRLSVKKYHKRKRNSKLLEGQRYEIMKGQERIEEENAQVAHTWRTVVQELRFLSTYLTFYSWIQPRLLVHTRVCVPVRPRQIIVPALCSVYRSPELSEAKRSQDTMKSNRSWENRSDKSFCMISSPSNKG